MTNAHPLANYNPYVIYSHPERKVLGFVEHINGDRAALKAEEVVSGCCIWNKWENASPAERAEAEKLGAIT